jgi:hypothetical protein
MADAVEPLVAGLLDLRPNERAFADSVLAGAPVTEQLFLQDCALAERVASHPALLWKVQNVRRHLGRSQ